MSSSLIRHRKPLTTILVVLFLVAGPIILGYTQTASAFSNAETDYLAKSSRSPGPYYTPFATDPTGREVVHEKDLLTTQTYESTQRQLSSRVQPGLSPINKGTLVVNIVFLGFRQRTLNISAIKAELPPWYAQINRMLYNETGRLVAYNNFTLDYRFSSASPEVLAGYVEFLNGNSVVARAPDWVTYAADVAYIKASAAEDWLAKNAPSLPGYTVYIIDVFDSLPSFRTYHFYNASVADYDRGTDPRRSSSSYAIAYGGRYNFLFMDLGAGWTLYGTDSRGRAIRWAAIWEFDLDDQAQVQTLNRIIGNRIRNAIQLRIIPSFLYEPSYSKSYFIDYRIYTADLVDYKSNFSTRAFLSELSNLQPNSSFSIEVTQQAIQNDRALFDAVQASFVKPGVLDGNKIIKYFQQNLQKYRTPHGTDKVIPVFVLGGYETPDYLGVAASDGRGNPAFVLEILNGNILTAGYGLTVLNAHEMAHVLGLAHPHDGFDWSIGKEYVDWLWDFSATPMTHLTQNLSYDSLNKQNLGQGVTALLVNRTTSTLSSVSSELGRLGFGVTPPNVSGNMSLATQSINNATTTFQRTTPSYVTAAGQAVSGFKQASDALDSIYSSLLTLTFRVQEKNNLPLPPGSVTVRLPNATAYMGQISTTADFVLTRLPWGDYEVKVSLPNATETRYAVMRWLDGSVANPRTISVTNRVTQFTVQYKTQYLLSVVSPPGLPIASQWFDSNTVAKLVVPYTWSVDLGKSRQNLVGYQIDGAQSVKLLRSNVGSYQLAILMTSSHSIAILGVTQYYLAVNGGNDIAYSPGSLFYDNWYDEGTLVQVTTNYLWNAVPGQSRQNLVSWQLDSGTPAPVVRRVSETFTTPPVVMNSYHVLTFNAAKQFFLRVEGAGKLNPESPTKDGWYDEGTEIMITHDNIVAVAPDGSSRTRLASYRVDTRAPVPIVSNTGSTALALKMNSPHTVSFISIRQYPLTVRGGSSQQVSPSSPTRDNWFDEETVIVVSTTYTWDEVPGRSRENLVSWELDGRKTDVPRQRSGAFSTSSIRMNARHEIKFNSVTQYFLTVAGGAGKVSPASPTGDSWYDLQMVVQVTAQYLLDSKENESRMNLVSWILDGSLRDLPRSASGEFSTSVIMNVSHSIGFKFVKQYRLSVSGGSGIVFNTASPTGDGWFDEGTEVTVSANNLWDAATARTRLRLASYTVDQGKPTVVSSVAGSTSVKILMNTTHLIQFIAQTQYYLKVNSPYGEASGEGWYDAGTTTEINVAPISVGFFIRQQFDHWSGGLTSYDHQTSVIMDGPKEVTAVWRTDYTQIAIVVGIAGAAAIGIFYLKRIKG